MAGTPTIASAGVNGATAVDAAKHRLLYIEDDRASLTLVEALIARRSDILLLSASDSVTGLATARAILPDVILMELNLPGMSGTEARRILADDPRTAHIPVIAISGNALPRDRQQGLADGFLRYLTKPIRINELMDTLELAQACAKGTLGAPP